MATPGLCKSFHFTQRESKAEEKKVRHGDKHTSGVGGGETLMEGCEEGGRSRDPPGRNRIAYFNAVL